MGRGTPLLVGAYRNGELVTFAPLVMRRRYGLRTIGFIAEGRADINGFVGEVTRETVDAVLKALPRGALRLADIRESDPLVKLLAAHVLRPYPNPLRQLGPDAPAGTGSNRRFQVRIPGYARRLAEQGRVEHEMVDFDTRRPEALALLDQFWQIHDLRHAGRRNAWKDPSNRAFLREYIEQSERSDVLAFVLKFNGRPVAFDLGFRAGSRFLLYIPAFHPDYDRFRPGHVNRFYSFPKCREMGMDIYDFSRGDSFAKRVWSTGEEWSVILTNSRLLAWIDELKILGRRWGLNQRIGRWLERLRRR